MIEILSLEFENIGLFTDKQSVSFKDKKDLIQVIAERSDYNGSSGSGKSTIFHAIDYVFGINQIPASALQSRKTKEGISVRIDILWDGEPVSIIRSKKSGLMVQGIDPKTKESFSVSGNVDQAEEKIDEIIGLPREVFKKMIHKTQKEGGFFLNLTPSESYKFLVKSLKLEEWLNKEVKAADLLSKIQSEVQKKEFELSVKKSNIENLKATLDGYSNDLLTIIQPEPKQTKNTESLYSKKEELEGTLFFEQQEIRNKRPKTPELISVNTEDLEEAKNYLKKEESSKLSELVAKESELKKSLFEKQSIPKTISLLTSKKDDKIKEILSIKQKIDKAMGHECPTCRQSWKDESIYSYVENLKKEATDLASIVKSTVSEISDLTLKVESLPEIDKNIKLIQSEISLIKDDYLQKSREIDLKIKEKSNEINKLNKEFNDKFQLAMNAWHEENSSIKSFYQSKINAIDMEIAAATSYNKMVESEIATYKLQKDTISANLKKAESNYETALKEVQMMESKVSEMIYSMEVIKQTRGAIKSFLNKTFQETLDQIGMEATLKLSKIPNASTSTIRFESFKEVKGKIKEEVTAFISINGDEDINIKTLSGGERSSIDGAVDLSVYKVIEERSGIGTNWIVLDEPFEGLDTQSRLDYIELLRESNLDKKIIIVDHTNEVKELAEETIKVIRENDKSYIQ